MVAPWWRLVSAGPLTVTDMKLFSQPTAPDPGLSDLTWLASRAGDLARKAVDRSAEDDLRAAVGDAAEAVRLVQSLLHQTVSAGRAAGIPWSELANYAGTSPEYLERAHDEYDVSARLLVPVAARTGWKPLG